MKINIIILTSVLIFFSISSDIQKKSPIINLKFSLQMKSLSQLIQNKQSVLTFQDFINQLKQNPQRLSQIGNLYVTGWPILQEQKVKTQQPNKQLTKNSIKDSQTNFTGSKNQTSQKRSTSSNSDLSNLFNNLNQNSILKQFPNLNNIRQIANQNINQKNQVKIQDIQNIQKQISLNKKTETQPTKMSLDSSIAYCAELTNNVRRKYNVSKLQINPLLNKIAQAHSEDMVRRRFFSHTNPDGEKVGDRAKKNNYTGMIGQNLAQAMSFKQAWDGFQKSPSHFQNQINPNWQNIGVGIAATNTGVLFITVLFSPKDIARNALTNEQLQKSLDSLSQGIINSNPNLKTVDKTLSSYIQQWLQNSQSMSIMDYVIKRGKYRTPMSAAQYTVSYSNDFVSRVIKNRYFANPNPILTKFGIGMKQEGQNLSIYVIYM